MRCRQRRVNPPRVGGGRHRGDVPAVRQRGAAGGATPLALRWIVALMLVGCGARPVNPVEAALYTDLRVIVVTEQRIDWLVDRIEFAQIEPRVLESVCQVSSARRRALRGWLDARLLAEGGSARAVWLGANRDLAAAKPILELERIRGALTHAESHIQDCPFWLTADPKFAGVQSSSARFTLLAESMGGAQLVFADEVRIGGAATARIIPTYGVTSNLSVGLGLEGGGASTFPRDESGQRSVKAVFTMGLPLLFRVSNGPWRFDSELAGTVRVPDGDTDALQPGVRASQAIGTTTVRVAGFMPYFMLWAGYEYLPDYNGQPGFTVLRVGPRFGVDWDP